MSQTHNIDIQQEDPSGSPHKGEPVYFVIGKLRRPHGISGEILFEMITENPTYFSAGSQVFIGEKKSACTILSIRQTNKLWLVSFEGFESREKVALLTNKSIYVPEEDLKPLPKDRFYHHEVIGMKVFTENNSFLGEVTEILETGANDVYVIQSSEGQELLIPAVKSVVITIDRDSRSIIVRPQEWG